MSNLGSIFLVKCLTFFHILRKSTVSIYKYAIEIIFLNCLYFIFFLAPRLLICMYV